MIEFCLEKFRLSTVIIPNVLSFFFETIIFIMLIKPNRSFQIASSSYRFSEDLNNFPDSI
jgi:hypothetical protein